MKTSVPVSRLGQARSLRQEEKCRRTEALSCMDPHSLLVSRGKQPELELQVTGSEKGPWPERVLASLPQISDEVQHRVH